MSESPDNIIITVVCEGESHVIKTRAGAYRNLMMLIYDNIYLENFGECRGMGRCATCMVEVLHSDSRLPGSERNEQATLSKSGVDITNVRLSCQLEVDKNLHNIHIRICGD